MKILSNKTGKSALIATLLFSLCMLDQNVGRAQLSPLLSLQTITADGSGELIQLDFADQGTGATNYVLEYTPEFGTVWVEVTGAAIVDLGDGNYRAVASHPGSPDGFYRVRGMGAVLMPVTASFSVMTLQAEEGASVVATLLFSAPFFGTARYTLDGTADSGDFNGLSGQVAVNGTQATIPIHLTDNENIGELKSLVLRLEPGEGYELGATSQSTVHILENDADWQGTLILGDANVGFILRLQTSNSVHMASLRSEPSGLFPTNEGPASVTLNDDYFSATAEQIHLPADSTLLNMPMTLALHLTAQDGEVDQFVESTEIKGQAVLVIQFPDAPQLNTTNSGAFLLTRTPVRPSTGDVELANFP